MEFKKTERFSKRLLFYIDKFIDDNHLKLFGAEINPSPILGIKRQSLRKRKAKSTRIRTLCLTRYFTKLCPNINPGMWLFFNKIRKYKFLYLVLVSSSGAYQTTNHLPTISQHRLASLTVFPLSQSMLLQFVRR